MNYTNTSLDPRFIRHRRSKCLTALEMNTKRQQNYRSTSYLELNTAVGIGVFSLVFRIAVNSALSHRLQSWRVTGEEIATGNFALAGSYSKVCTVVNVTVSPATV